ncbi:hypothetical protein N9L08_10050, partial [Rhodobacteraceae bacterium]|nr:hypothetical protein [Paracoccaceae bacterium]
RERLLSMVNCSELFAAMDTNDYGSFINPSFNERLVWAQMADAGLLSDFSNSFFIVAGFQRTRLFSNDWLGEIYSHGRKREFTTRTRFELNNDELVTVSKSKMYTHYNVKEGKILHHDTRDVWRNGKSIHTLMLAAHHLSCTRTFYVEMKIIVQAWWLSINEQSIENEKLAGDKVDAIWRNCIKQSDGNSRIIDTEWEWSNEIPKFFLIYRAVRAFYEAEFEYSTRWSKRRQLVPQFFVMRTIAKFCDVRLSIGSVWECINLDVEFCAETQGKRLKRSKVLVNIFLPLLFLRTGKRILRTYKTIIEKVRNRFRMFSV